MWTRKDDTDFECTLQKIITCVKYVQINKINSMTAKEPKKPQESIKQINFQPGRTPGLNRQRIVADRLRLMSWHAFGFVQACLGARFEHGSEPEFSHRR